MTGDQQFLLALGAQLVTVVLALITALTSRGNRASLHELHLKVDGRLDQLVYAKAEAAHATGVVEGAAIKAIAPEKEG